MLQKQSFLGESEIARNILDEIRLLQGISRINVIIIGESGTGKEVIARDIHAGSDRAEGPFIPINCTAIPHELAESAFFGHVRGAFSGASESHKGYFELAHGGTLFLDEIGDMSLDLQPKLLRAIEDRSVLPVGGTTPKHADVRIIAATNQDLLERITEGAFRRDLYFRLGQFTIEVPPLRERKEDIPLLAEHFLKLSSSEMGIPQPTLSPEALSTLESYYFPGNVRELSNIVKAALLRSRGESVIGSEHLLLIDPSVFRTLQPDLEAAVHVDEDSPVLEDVERIVIQRAQKSAKREVEAGTTSLIAEEEKILSYVREHGSINNAECRELLSVDRRHATYLLRKLCRYGLLVSEGELRWARYVAVHDTTKKTAPVLRAVCTVDAGADQIAHAGEEVSFSGSFSDPCGIDVYTAVIDWGDGSLPDAGLVNETNGSGTVTSTHVYTTAGRHTITLTIATDDGDAEEDTAIVDVIGTVYVDFCNPASDDSPGHGSEGKPYKTIQYGIDMVLSSSTVIVAGGTPESPQVYTGAGNTNLDMEGKAITVRSSSGPAGCIIDCGGSGRGFYFHSGETNASILDGFTITNGSGVGYGGGIYCESASPTITNCVITGNISSQGGGIFCKSSSPTITNCTIKNNTTSHYGGGIYCYSSSAPIIDNTAVSDNNANISGGGILCDSSSSPTITNATVTGNNASYHGGGILCSSSAAPTITNATVTGNNAGENGGGICCTYSTPTITNATITGNTSNYGGGIYCESASPTIINATITGNVASDGGGIYSQYTSTITNTILWGDSPNEISGEADASYSDIQGGYEGMGNINRDPRFVDAVNGDYHLTDTSPCIGAGTSDAVSDTDMDGNPRGTPPDMGAYENSRDMPLPKIIYVNATTGDDANGDGVSTPYRTIQKGIDEANDVDTVVVENGTYTGPGDVDIDFFGKSITVRSANGPESCIIDCGGSGRGFYFHSGETGISVLNGFTITNGFAEYGAGICCMSSSPRILNIIIAGNTASQSGGGIHCHFSNATIEDTIITENNASEYGGGIHCYSSNLTVIDTTIAANISNCGGGLACHTRSSPTIINTTITGNNAISEGGGGVSCLGSSSPTITNATITGNNTSRDGAGIYCDISSSPIITNTILWGDTPCEIYGDGLPISYSDIQGGFSGIGNIDMDPLFVDAANDNYRLRDDSPCIGAGTSENAPAEDIEGNPRKTPPDMGAYESVQTR